MAARYFSADRVKETSLYQRVGRETRNDLFGIVAHESLASRELKEAVSVTE
jgi:hypothetical protein